MPEITWETLKKCYCEQANADVALEAQIVYPAEYLPDQGPRVLAHRCSKGLDCAINNLGSCVWSGSNPNFDPFEK